MEQAIMITKLKLDIGALEKFTNTLLNTSLQREEFSKGHQERLIAAAKKNVSNNGSPKGRRWDPANDGLDMRGAGVKYWGDNEGVKYGMGEEGEQSEQENGGEKREAGETGKKEDRVD
jgi:hypothetical protein